VKEEEYIYHLIGRKEWKEAEQKGVLEPDSLQEEGFIHLCEEGQIETVLEFEDKPEEELVALKVNLDRVKDDIRYENKFPHLYRNLRSSEVCEAKPLVGDS
jgi:uncharacterized protein (DUF952 family)